MNKKILIIYNGYLKKGGGVALYLEYLENALIKEKFNVDVWSRDNLNITIKYFCAILQRFGDYVLPGIGYILYILITKLYLYFLIKKDQYDIYIFNDLLTAFDNKSSYIIIHSFRADIEQNYHISGLRKKIFTLILSFYEKRVIKQTKHTHLFTVSEEFKEEIYSKLNCIDKEIKILYPPFHVNKKDFVNYTLKKQNKIVFAGMLHSRKNPVFAIELLRKLIYEFNKDYKLEILGDGILKDDLMNLVKKYNLNKYVIFRGYIANKDVLEIMRESKILILPSFSESFGLVLLEAKLNGMITIVNKDLAIPKWLVDFPLEINIQAWSEKIVEVMENYTLYNANSKKNIKTIIENNFNQFLLYMKGE